MKKLLIILLLFLLMKKAGAQSSNHTNTTTIDYSISVDDSTAIWAVLDSFMVNFRQPLEVYIKRHLQTYLFPHVRIASGTVTVIPNVDSMPVNYWKARMPANWDHSEWVTRKIVQAGAKKVHVAVVFRRFRKDNTVIADEASLYILEKVNGKWGIRGRSSYAM